MIGAENYFRVRGPNGLYDGIIFEQRCRGGKDCPATLPPDEETENGKDT